MASRDRKLKKHVDNEKLPETAPQKRRVAIYPFSKELRGNFSA
jgi:hypothetical protein